MNKRIILPVALLVLVSFSVYSRGRSEYCRERDFRILIHSNTNSVTITGYRGRNTDIQIPSEIRGKPVTGIATNAFESGHKRRVPRFIRFIVGRQFTSIVIPQGVTFIGRGAFMFNQLAFVTVPGTVAVIDDFAFMDNQLTGIVFPYGVEVIGTNAFAGNLLGNVAIPESVNEIRGGAFSHNQLTCVIIPSSITSIKWGYLRIIYSPT